MKKINVPIKNIGKYEGKWVVVDPRKEAIIAVGQTLNEIRELVVHSRKAGKILAPGKAPYSYLVPRHDEGPYVL